MLKFLRSQGVQNPLQLDTSWLGVGHVDEFIQFVPAPGSRLGWRAMIADPRQAVQMLSDVAASGHSGQILHANLPKLEWPYDLYIETRNIGEFLADQQFIKTNDIAAKRIATNIATLKLQAGLTEADIVRVPTLYTYKSLDYYLLKTQVDSTPPGPEKDKLLAQLNSFTEAAAEIPNAVNGLALNDGVYIAPKQYGPVINGKDIFEEAVTKAFQRTGLQTKYVDDLLDAHFSGGEVHCVTNTFRTFPG
jgi:protein-arginine deiminase